MGTLADCPCVLPSSHKGLAAGLDVRSTQPHTPTQTGTLRAENSVRKGAVCLQAVFQGNNIKPILWDPVTWKKIAEELI